MMSLIQAETQRLLSRRMTRYFPLALAGLMVVGIVIAYFNVGSGGVDFVSDIASSRTGLPGDKSTDVLGPMGFLVPIMAFVIGASYFGADQKSGMIEQLLTWEPRRFRLLLGRLAGGMAAMFIITAALSMFLVILLYLLSSVTGSVDGVFDIWQTVFGAVIRSGITGAIFFALGLGVTVITNSSVGSIVGFLIYVFVVELALIQPLLPKIGLWLPMLNADAFVARTDVSEGTIFDGSSPFADVHHGYFTAGLLLLVWAAIAYGVALLIFQRRDID